MSRKIDRRHATCLLFASQFHTDNTFEIDDQMEYYKEFYAPEVLEAGFSEPGYILQIFNGVSENIKRIDELISEASQTWEITRMARVDLSVMRIAIYEMLYVEGFSASIAINEALENAKLFSGDDAYKFVNGVLEKVRRIEGR